MSYHPAYPSTADLRREHDAEERDLADRLRVSTLEAVIRNTIAQISAVSEFEHPDANYSVAELGSELRGLLTNLDGIADILHGAVVLDEAA
jgi:hypothetical protein